MKSDLIDLTLHCHAMTEHAILVSDAGDEDHAILVSLSQCEVLKRPGGIVEITMPEWLAKEKGLI